MSRYWAPKVTANSHLSLEYATLHQQRRYLLDNLAKQEARGERLANLLEVVKVKLSVAQPLDEGPDSKKALKNSRKTLAYKLTTCERTEKSLADNLILLTARMNFVEQNQWRMANAAYNQSTQYDQLGELAASMQNMALVSPLTPGFPIKPGYSQGFVSPTTPFYPWPTFPPISEGYQLFSPTPMLQPNSSIPYGHMVAQQPNEAATQQDSVFEGLDEIMQVDIAMSPLSLAAKEFVPAQRALSLPNIEETRSNGTVEGQSTGLTRQLSLANRGSAALRLQKMSS